MQFTAITADNNWRATTEISTSATIESVFRRALNLRLGSGELLSIFPVNSPSNPSGLIGSHEAGQHLGLVGESVEITPRRITFKDAVISLSNCQYVSNKLTGEVANLPSIDCLKQFESMVQAQAKPGSFYGAVAGDTFNQAQVKRLESTRKNLIDALAQSSSADIAQATKQLIGLGVGLTPSGDDYLLGLMLVLDQSSLANSHSLATLKQTINDNLEATTSVSQQYFGAGLDRQYSEPLRRLFNQLAQQDTSAKDTLTVVMNHGATSGQDTCTGMNDGWNLLHTLTKRSS